MVKYFLLTLLTVAAVNLRAAKTTPTPTATATVPSCADEGKDKDGTFTLDRCEYGNNWLHCKATKNEQGEVTGCVEDLGHRNITKWGCLLNENENNIGFVVNYLVFQKKIGWSPIGDACKAKVASGVATEYSCFFPGFLFRGTKIGTFISVDGLLDCQEACAGESSCTHWTYKFPEAPATQAKCKLYSAVKELRGPIEEHNFVSGPKENCKPLQTPS